MLLLSNLKRIKERLLLKNNKYYKKTCNLSTNLIKMWQKWVRCSRSQSLRHYSQINSWNRFKKNCDLQTWLSESISMMMLRNKNCRVYFKHLSITPKLYHNRFYKHKFYKGLFSNKHIMVFNSLNLVHSFKHHLLAATPLSSIQLSRPIR